MQYKKWISEKVKDNMFLIVVGLLALIAVFSPYIQKDLIIGADSPFHLARIETLALELKRGVFPAKVHTDLCYGFGYGVGFFYSNFFIYIAAILINLGLSLEVSFKLFALIIQLAIFAAMFISANALVKNKYNAMVAALLYQFSVTVLESFYKRFSVGRSTAMIFLPLAVVGIYLLVTEGKKAYLFGIGFIGLIYSHVLTTMMAVAVCVVILLVYWKQWVKCREIWKKLIGTTVCVLLLTAAYWIPFLEQWLAQKYRAAEPWTWVDENVPPLLELMRPYEGVGYMLLALTIIIGLWMMSEKADKGLKVFYFMGVVFMLITVVNKFWQITRNAFKFLQFPRRLLLVATVLLIFAVILWIAQLDLSQKKMKAILTVLVIVGIVFTAQFVEKRGAEIEDFAYRTIHEEIAGLGAGEEWLPLQTTREYLVNPDTAYDDQGQSVTGVKADGEYTFQAAGGSTYYDVPFVWYKGFAATMDGSALEIQKVPETGLVRVMIPANQSGEIVVRYAGTVLQKAAYIINVVSVVIMLVVGIVLIRKKYKSK